MSNRQRGANTPKVQDILEQSRLEAEGDIAALGREASATDERVAYLARAITNLGVAADDGVGFTDDLWNGIVAGLRGGGITLQDMADSPENLRYSGVDGRI